MFSYRNYLFPVFYLMLFIPSPEISQNRIATGIAGLVLIFAGTSIRCITIGLEYIVRGGYKRVIHAERLVTGGIYNICRNPMYLGNLVVLSGFGLYANSAIFLGLIFPVFILFYVGIIKAEEAFLYRKFGGAYDDYRKKVHAIIPSVKRIYAAFKGYNVNWQKVIFKEYNSTFLYISGILLLSLHQQKLNFRLFSILLFIAVVIYLIIKRMKYKSSKFNKG